MQDLICIKENRKSFFHHYFISFILHWKKLDKAPDAGYG
jgi:hypothetical protein